MTIRNLASDPLDASINYSWQTGESDIFKALR
jgi:hypothetical protein